ncbi:hypothetical protein I3843_14G047000 [Carya illinoinensis]|nr:hypothetical protein I3843_14G047000 [Carya illinoinensis]
MRILTAVLILEAAVLEGNLSIPLASCKKIQETYSKCSHQPCMSFKAVLGFASKDLPPMMLKIVYWHFLCLTVMLVLG